MTVTKAQLRTLVGRELEILPSNRNSLNAADGALVDEFIDGVRAWLIEAWRLALIWAERLRASPRICSDSLVSRAGI